jgi:hypothetical protein
MFGRQVRIQPVLGSKNMNISDRANEGDGLRSSSGIFSWRLAQRALPELKYVLTINGYVTLS